MKRSLGVNLTAMVGFTTLVDRIERIVAAMHLLEPSPITAAASKNRWEGELCLVAFLIFVKQEIEYVAEFFVFFLRRSLLYRKRNHIAPVAALFENISEGTTHVR